MKLTVKLTLYLLAIIVLVLAIDAVVRFRKELELFRHTRAEEHERVGVAVARMAVAIYTYEGHDEAREVLDEAARRSHPIHLAWVCEHGEALVAGACSRLRQSVIEDDDDDDDEGAVPLVSDIVGERYVTYVPLRDNDGQWLGALELSETVTREQRFVGRLFGATAIAMLAVGGACVVASFVLGTWLVGRPIERLIRQARSIGEGNLERLPMIEQADELGDLSVEMDRTIERLREAHARAEREQAAREDTLRKLHHNDRLSTVGKLASGLAHELGTPLNVIVLNAGLLKNEKGMSAFAAESIDAVAEASDRMARLVSTLLAFARRPALAKTIVDLREVARATTTMLESLAQAKGVGIVQDLPKQQMACDADALALSQALANLMTNAVDVSPAGSDVTLSGEIEGDTLRISVRDRGAGVPQDIRSAIFEPFFTTKDVGEGTGLGLSIAYEIATAHGGSIDLADANPGSVFTLSLPRSPNA